MDQNYFSFFKYLKYLFSKKKTELKKKKNHSEQIISSSDTQQVTFSTFYPTCGEPIFLLSVSTLYQQVALEISLFLH